MDTAISLQGLFLHLVILVLLCQHVSPCQEHLAREDFPDGFLFGTSSSSYQYEGAISEDGKSPSNWDLFTRIPGGVTGGTNGDIADDHYHRYMEDIELMHSLGVDAYRFSISWSRLLPRGRSGDANQFGLLFYNRIIDELLTRGIEPFVTIQHSELPQEIEDTYGSWLDPRMQDEFVHLADTCFKNFGDRVKYWMTINEPNLISLLAYAKGVIPPGRCSVPFGNCLAGNSTREPFLVAHNMILAHAKAVDLYRSRYQLNQGGRVGITIECNMFKPLRETPDDRQAVTRGLAFKIAWVLDPLILGDYPVEMIEILGCNLPRFSRTEANTVRNSLDFIGVNHYSTTYAKDCMNSPCESGGTPTDGFVYSTELRDGELIGERTAMENNFVVPDGIESVIGYLKRRYNGMPLYITENGYGGFNLPDITEAEHLNDVKRVEYHTSYLRYIHKSIREGADVRGYFIWSLLDNFEWRHGYTVRFGIYHVDFSNLRRKPKMSALWYRDLLKGKGSKIAELGKGSSTMYTNI